MAKSYWLGPACKHLSDAKSAALDGFADFLESNGLKLVGKGKVTDSSEYAHGWRSTVEGTTIPLMRLPGRRNR